MKPIETVGDCMTMSLYTIDRHASLRAAHELMRERQIRHLPVLVNDRLVGILSDRDLHLIESLRDIDPATVTVEEAMTPDPFTVEPGAALDRVAFAMAKHKYGSAVVVEKGKVVGIFTTTDALWALLGLLGQPGRTAHETPDRL